MRTGPIFYATQLCLCLTSRSPYFYFISPQVVLHCFSFDESLESLSKQLGTQNFHFEENRRMWKGKTRMIWKVKNDLKGYLLFSSKTKILRDRVQLSSPLLPEYTVSTIRPFWTQTTLLDYRLTGHSVQEKRLQCQTLFNRNSTAAIRH